jgi:uncharacterized protein
METTMFSFRLFIAASIFTVSAAASASDSTPLIIAVQRNDLKTVRSLLASGADVNHKTEDGKTALYAAIERLKPRANNLPMVDALLQAGADVNEPIFFEASPLAVSLTRDYANQAVTLRLLGAGAHVSRTCEPEDSSVSLAAQNDWADVVKALLRAGAPANCQNKGGETALHWAAMNAFNDVVVILLEGGANPHLRDNEGKTPLDVAVVTNPDKRVQKQFAQTRALLSSATQKG